MKAGNIFFGEKHVQLRFRQTRDTVARVWRTFETDHPQWAQVEDCKSWPRSVSSTQPPGSIWTHQAAKGWSFKRIKAGHWMVGHRCMLSIFQDVLRFHLTSVVFFPVS
jgi:hypothetical protein